MPRDAGERHSPGLQMQEEEDIIRDETAPCQDLDRKEVGSGQDGHMRRDEVFPSSLLAALWCRCDAVALQDIPDCLIGDMMTEVGQRRQCDHNPSRSFPEPYGRSGSRPRRRCATDRDTSGTWIRRTYTQSWRYQARMVSGLATHATSARYLRPIRLPISARVDLSGTESRSRAGRC